MGEGDDSLKSKKVVFVTVGTTCFDSLVRAVDTQEVREALFKKGYTHLVIQMGRGTYIPTKVIWSSSNCCTPLLYIGECTLGICSF